MVSTVFGIGIVFMILGIGIRFAAGLTTSNPLDGLLTIAPTDLPINIQKSSYWFFSFVSSWIFLSGVIFIVAGFIRLRRS